MGFAVVRSSGMVIDAVRIDDGADTLDGDLHMPEHARALVIVAHGSGSSRFSSRNRQVAESLHVAHYATLLLDLLTRREEAVDVLTAEYRFDIARLGRRVMAATDWAAAHQVIRDLPVAYFGASTGAAAALIAAAERPSVAAVISRGGRPDLAGDALPKVKSPTLLIVGGDDGPVIDLNEAARRRLTAEVELAIVAGATHLFEEPGTLEQVERLAVEWLNRHIRD